MHVLGVKFFYKRNDQGLLHQVFLLPGTQVSVALHEIREGAKGYLIIQSDGKVFTTNGSSLNFEGRQFTDPGRGLGIHLLNNFSLPVGEFDQTFVVIKNDAMHVRLSIAWVTLDMALARLRDQL